MVRARSQAAWLLGTLGLAACDGSETTAMDGGTGFSFPAECGNGFVEEDEQCDDANDDDDDACTNACLIPCGVEWTALQTAPTRYTNMTPAAMVQAEDGRVFVVGRIDEDRESPFVDTPFQDLPDVVTDAYTVHAFDADGATIWSTRIPHLFDALVHVAVARDGQGRLYLAETADMGGRMHTALRIFDERDGSTTRHPSGYSTDLSLATALAIADDGSPLLAERVGFEEYDVALTKFDAATSKPVWTNTWKDDRSETVLIDRFGSLAVAPDATIYIFALEHLEGRSEATAVILRGAPDGNELERVYVPLADHPTATEAVGFTIDPEGIAVLALQDKEQRFFVERVDLRTGVPLWRLEHGDFADLGDTVGGITSNAAGDVFVTGASAVDASRPHVEAWYGRYDASGHRLCGNVFVPPREGLVTPALSPRLISASEGPAVSIGAEHVHGDETSMWVARFRGQ